MIGKSPLSLAVWRYDRTQPLYDGRVEVPGFELELIDAPLEEIFSRALEGAEFDVSELSFSNYLRLSVAGKCAYAGLPIFPSRSFRHGVFYVRDDDTIRSPRDLIGKRVGVREYSMTAALAARGALRDHYGVEAQDIKWVMGDVDEVERDAIVLPELYRPISIEALAPTELLTLALLDGELDAILAYKPILPFKEGKGVRRLIQDHPAAEADYFGKTSIFPIMHLMGIRKDVATKHPGLPAQLVSTFGDAQDLATEDLRTEQALKIGLPWIGAEYQRTVQIMGEQFWPQGLTANRKVIERMVEWSYLDGLISRIPAIEDLFPYG